jgi:hypothetical protein
MIYAWWFLVGWCASMLLRAVLDVVRGVLDERRGIRAHAERIGSIPRVGTTSDPEGW